MRTDEQSVVERGGDVDEGWLGFVQLEDEQHQRSRSPVVEFGVTAMEVASFGVQALRDSLRGGGVALKPLLVERRARARPLRATPHGAQGPLAFERSPIRDLDRQIVQGSGWLFPKHPQKPIGGQRVIEGEQDKRPSTVIVGWPLIAVVALIGSKLGGHRGGPDRAPLPFEEERLVAFAPAEHTEGVGLNRVESAVEAEVARGPVRRVELEQLTALRPSLVSERS